MIVEPPIYLYDTLSPSQKSIVEQLTVFLGASQEQCTRALMETDFKIELAANWYFSNPQKLEVRKECGGKGKGCCLSHVGQPCISCFSVTAHVRFSLCCACHRMVLSC